MIDFHCHLDLYPNPSVIAALCDSKKVRLLSVTTVPSAFEGTSALTRSYSHINTALGLHPELVAVRHHELGLFEKLLTRTQFVGEVGLDGSARHRATLPQQEAILRDILRMSALAGGRIFSLHSRGAAAKILDVLSKQPNAGKFVLHWFTGTKREVGRAVELGCWFSINPAMFSSRAGRSALAAIPRNRVVPESDGPFGRFDEQPAKPWDAWSIVSNLATLWAIAPDEVAKTLETTYCEILR
jgi:TatD DNase family protein